MKEKLFDSLKKAKENPTIMNTSIISLLFIVFIVLSINRNGLFLKEIVLSASIICMALLNNK